MVVVDLTLATICFLGQCYPALVGKDTPVGTYQLQHARTSQSGYGGDVLAFKQYRPGEWFTVHRVFTGRPSQRRLEKLKHGSTKDRINVTLGCINVAPDVYQKLVDCCSNQKIVIKGK